MNAPDLRLWFFLALFSVPLWLFVIAGRIEVDAGRKSMRQLVPIGAGVMLSLLVYVANFLPVPLWFCQRVALVAAPLVLAPAFSRFSSKTTSILVSGGGLLLMAFWAVSGYIL